jgi:hypothetical protein
MQKGVRIRFYAALARPSSPGGDTIVLVREAPVTPSGAIHEDSMPADLPMFEQLVDAEGRVLRSAMGPAHVPGFNSARMGSGTKCVGCHAGHSPIAVPPNYHLGKITNASPSAVVRASSSHAAGAGARAAVDRRARGRPSEVAWVAEGARNEWLRLEWGSAVEARGVVLYACAASRADSTDIRVGEAELHLLRGGAIVQNLKYHKTLSAKGTRLDFDPVEVDAIEIRLGAISGRVLGRHAAALAEVETLARLVE